MRDALLIVVLFLCGGVVAHVARWNAPGSGEWVWDSDECWEGKARPNFTTTVIDLMSVTAQTTIRLVAGEYPSAALHTCNGELQLAAKLALSSWKHFGNCTLTTAGTGAIWLTGNASLNGSLVADTAILSKNGTVDSYGNLTVVAGLSIQAWNIHFHENSMFSTELAGPQCSVAIALNDADFYGSLYLFLAAGMEVSMRHPYILLYGAHSIAGSVANWEVPGLDPSAFDVDYFFENGALHFGFVPAAAASSSNSSEAPTASSGWRLAPSTSLLLRLELAIVSLLVVGL